jgi:hypothetical protein
VVAPRVVLNGTTSLAQGVALNFRLVGKPPPLPREKLGPIEFQLAEIFAAASEEIHSTLSTHPSPLHSSGQIIVEIIGEM